MCVCVCLFLFCFLNLCNKLELRWLYLAHTLKKNYNNLFVDHAFAKNYDEVQHLYHVISSFTSLLQLRGLKSMAGFRIFSRIFTNVSSAVM